MLLIGHIAAIAKRLIGEAAKAQQLELELISRKQTTHHQRAEISVMTLASRVIASPLLMQRIGNPLDYLHRLRAGYQRLQCSTPLAIIRGETSNADPFLRCGV